MIKRNHAFIENIPSNERLLFQDVNYLVTLPEKELRLTIENRIIKLSEQKTLKKAEDAEKELDAIDDEALTGVINKDKNHYLISIDLHCTRQDAIHIAREIKNLLGTSEFIVDMKLLKKHDQ